MKTKNLLLIMCTGAFIALAENAFCQAKNDLKVEVVAPQPEPPTEAGQSKVVGKYKDGSDIIEKDGKKVVVDATGIELLVNPEAKKPENTSEPK